MHILDTFVSVARKSPRRIVLPETDDERILSAARVLCTDGIATPILIGDPDTVYARAAQAGISLKDVPADTLTICSPADTDRIERYADAYARSRGVKTSVARRLVKKPLALAGMMVRQGDADCMVAGCAHATGTLLQNAAMTVGLSPDISAPSSMFIMVLPRFLDQKDTPLVFADAAVRVAPDARRLAEIGVLAARNTRALLDIEPVVAFLSFSTRGSAAHERVDMVKEAVSIARNMAPDTAIDGELQADAAIVPAVAAKKAPESTVAGRANVLVFPDLASGNIAYKLVQYTAQAHAIGPVLQGFDKPVNDLSRGASVDDIVYLCAVTAVQYLRTNHGETI